MDYLYKMLTLLLIFLIHKNSGLVHKACCCYYEKDVFRGFTLVKPEVIEINYVNYFEKITIINSFIDQCQVYRQGFSPKENIQRLRDNVHNLDEGTCKKECDNLLKEINEKYITKTIENRLNSAKLLREKKTRLEAELEEKITENMQRLNGGGSTCHTIVSQNVSVSKVIKSRQSNGKKLDLKLSQRNCCRGGPMAVNSIMVTERKPKSDNFSLSTLTSQAGHDNKQEAFKIEVKADKKDFKEELNELDDFEFNEGSDLKLLISKIELEINYMMKKNSKPLDYIMNRFNIDDEILVRIIKIFEFTLEDIISSQNKEIADNAYYQFRLVEKLQMKELSVQVSNRKI